MALATNQMASRNLYMTDKILLILGTVAIDKFVNEFYEIIPESWNRNYSLRLEF